MRSASNAASRISRSARARDEGEPSGRRTLRLTCPTHGAARLVTIAHETSYFPAASGIFILASITRDAAMRRSPARVAIVTPFVSTPIATAPVRYSTPAASNALSRARFTRCGVVRCESSAAATAVRFENGTRISFAFHPLPRRMR